MLGVATTMLIGCALRGEDGLVCSLPFIDSPAEMPADPCREGSLIFGPTRLVRSAGSPDVSRFPINVGVGGPACVTAVAGLVGGGDTRTAAAIIELDEQQLLGPERFNQQVTTVEQRFVILPGLHTLSARLASAPESVLDLSLRAGGTGERHGLIRGRHLELYNLFADPAAFSPQVGQVQLMAQGTVLRFMGLPSHQRDFLVSWRFEIRDPFNCAVVRALEGQSDVDEASSFTAVGSWDGTDDGGRRVADSAYLYRLVAKLVAITDEEQGVVEELATAQQSLLLDGTPPVVTILSPRDGAVLDVPMVQVDALLSDNFSGVDPSSIRVSLDGVDRSAELLIQPDRVSGVLAIGDGLHRLEVSAGDRAGNVTVGVATFSLDVTAPIIDIVSPLDGARVPTGTGLTFVHVVMADLPSGVDIVTVRVLVDGVDRTPDMPTLTATEVRGHIQLDDGLHVIDVTAGDFFDHVGTASASFVIAKDLSAALLDLEPSNPEGVLYRAHEDGSLRDLSGSDLSLGCRTRVGDETQATEFVQCLLTAASALLRVNGEDPAMSPWRVTRLEHEDDGLSFVRIEQMYGDLPVRGGRVALVVRNGRVGSGGKLVDYHGRLVAPSAIPGFDPSLEADPEAALAAAEASYGAALILGQRYFDATRQAVVSEYIPLDGAGVRILLDERTLEVFRVKSVVSPLEFGLVEKTTSVGIYEDAFSDPTGTDTAARVDVLSIGAGGDRCLLCLDHGSGSEDGEPKVCDGGLESGDCDNGNPDCEVGSCEAGIDFNNFFTNWMGFKQGAMMNVYFWVHDLAVFANHQRAAYDDWYRWRNAENLKVVVPTSARPCGANAQACAIPGYTEYRIVLPTRTRAHTSLATMAHEYGHFIHYMYDRFGEEDVYARALDEGWADHNVLRYAMFRHRESAARPHDRFELNGPLSASLNRAMNAFHVLSFSEHGGEWIAVPLDWQGEDPAGQFPTDLWMWDLLTNRSLSGDPYERGAIVPIVYWLLAWNKFRSPYWTWFITDPILYESVYADRPERPANVAFTYAMKALDDNSADTSDFFAKVWSRYRRFYEDDRISGDELYRVAGILKSVCVGPHRCTSSEFHRFPGSRLPARETMKSFFWPHPDPTDPSITGGVQEMLVAQNDMQRGGTVTEVPFGTRDFGETFLGRKLGLDGWKFARLDSTDDFLEARVYFPWTGTYSFSAVVRAPGPGQNRLWIDTKPPSQSRRNCLWNIEDEAVGKWGWSHDPGPSTRIHITEGFRTVYVMFQNLLDIEALHIRFHSFDPADATCPPPP